MPYNNYYQNYPFMQGMPYMQNYQQPIQQAQQPAQIQDGGVVCVKDDATTEPTPLITVQNANLVIDRIA